MNKLFIVFTIVLISGCSSSSKLERWDCKHQFGPVMNGEVMITDDFIRFDNRYMKITNRSDWAVHATEYPDSFDFQYHPIGDKSKTMNLFTYETYRVFEERYVTSGLKCKRM